MQRTVKPTSRIQRLFRSPTICQFGKFNTPIFPAGKNFSKLKESEAKAHIKGMAVRTLVKTSECFKAMIKGFSQLGLLRIFRIFSYSRLKALPKRFLVYLTHNTRRSSILVAIF